MSKYFKLTDFHCSILKILRDWSKPTLSGHDGIWKGYSQLFDELYEIGFREEMKYVKNAVKSLCRHGYLVYETTYNNDYQINGKGYFYNNALERITE